MIVLAIDTAGVDCAAAVFESETGKMLGRVSETIGRGHAERLMAMIDDALAEAKLTLTDVERIGVTVGPGSFTGIRVGVAAARGLALALGVECVGVSTLEVLARTASSSEKPVLAAINAHRDQVYAQGFERDVPQGEPLLLELDDYLARATAPGVVLVGSASTLVNDREAETAPDHYPIDLVARISATAKAQGKPRPLYLRGPDAKPQAGFAVSRA
ncbi:tRNA (adenosine(37)-N6)-threonylcarbamoyltransferase complex dimerization subunit type 1 TsaB [Rhizobium sp. 'Codium 1']|uniref:tRNA (adenosine(37)-N6)-threonylcarbamoyltransferase complex dimerization subunit type 1 TsaB n=1 Tax=Rhizobium sp. 'Codium 1' TaxID=2940484 RepID=UPI001E59E3C8|nr:tRNA (adenosine(37)-N6)-threonylcarbamoyltransferase complex dimerization subunit type 1 TsaB [Rhizobium sp. 'Codium 1']MCC8931657.1 tRNA (adenosine(37)-N6)-threonylcarbamoyltransferase complex dimerization subunit type 1 TsaB [Rhizobium sp. 'Codium 1']